MLLVTLQLHEETYAHLNVQRPTNHHPLRPLIGQATPSPEVADTGAHTDIISPDTLKSLGYDHDTLFKMKVRVASVTKGLQREIRGGIFLSVRFPNHSNQRSTVRLFHVADNVSQNYLSRSSLLALSVVGPNFPKIGASPQTPLDSSFLRLKLKNAPQGRGSGTLTSRPA